MARAAGGAVGKSLGGFAQGFVQGAAGGAAGGFTGGFLLGTYQTGDLVQGLRAGVKGAVIGGLTAGIAGGIINGLGVAFPGKNSGQDPHNFWSGNNIASGRGRFALNNTARPTIEVGSGIVEFPGGNIYQQNGKLIYGNDKWSVNHNGNIDNYLAKKQWTPQEIQETLNHGKDMGKYGTVLKPGPTQGNTTIRIHNPQLNKSLIYDPTSKQIIQLGMPGYEW